VTRLAFLLAALAACGGEEVLIPVTLNLDSSTCATNSPAQVTFSCDSALGAWVRRGDPADPDTSESACVDVATNGMTLAALPEILSQSIDLSGISAGDVWLEIGVYSPASADDGCPEIAALDQNMSVYGRSRATDLAGPSHGITLILQCYAVDDGSELDACTTRCNEVHDYCPTAYESGPCDLDSNACYEACPADDEPCYAACDADYDVCIEDQPTPCNDADTICYEECMGDINCEDECCMKYEECVQDNCETSHTVCLGRCEALQDSCATSM
jgi:hypothetical protein